MNSFLDNFIKGPLTSLLGFGIMIASAYGWWVDYLTDWQGGGFGLVGFALLWMRDKLPEFVTQFIKLIFDKFRGGPPAATILLLLITSTTSFSQVVSDTTMSITNDADILHKIYKPQRMYNMIQDLINSKVNSIDTLDRLLIRVQDSVLIESDKNMVLINGHSSIVLDSLYAQIFVLGDLELWGWYTTRIRGQQLHIGELGGSIDFTADNFTLNGSPAMAGEFFRGDGTWEKPGNFWTLPLQATSTNFNDATTYYMGYLPNVWTSTVTIRKIYITQSCTLKVAEIYTQSQTSGSNESWSMYIRKNNTTDTLISTLSSSSGERRWSNSALNISFSPGDYLEVKTVTPTWVTDPATTVTGGYLGFESN